LSAGDVLILLESNGEWWKGRSEDGSVGMFPSTYVQEFTSAGGADVGASGVKKTPPPVPASPTPSKIDSPTPLPDGR